MRIGKITFKETMIMLKFGNRHRLNWNHRISMVINQKFKVLQHCALFLGGKAITLCETQSSAAQRQHFLVLQFHGNCFLTIRRAEYGPIRSLRVFPGRASFESTVYTTVTSTFLISYLKSFRIFLTLSSSFEFWRLILLIII